MQINVAHTSHELLVQLFDEIDSLNLSMFTKHALKALAESAVELARKEGS